MLRRFILSLALALPLSAAAGAFQLTSFVVNPQLIISIYNVAKQNNNQVSQLPPDLLQYSSVVQIQVNNTSSSPQSPIFELQVSDQACGPILAGTRFITTINPVAPGIHTIGAAELKVYDFSGCQASQCFEDEVKNNFSDPSKIADAVNKLIQTTFSVCLQLYDPAGTPQYTDKVCTPLQFFNQQTGNLTTVPILIYPHNNGIKTHLPQFVWARASKPGLDPSLIKYRLELSEREPNNVVERVEYPRIGQGQTFYQWSAGNRDLKSGTKYYWRVIGLDGDAPIGGNADSGWNITKWFEIEEGEQVAVTLGDLDAWTRAAAAGESGVKNIIEKMKIDGVIDPPSLADELFKQIKNGEATIVGVSAQGK